jgi:hypothetical protein
VGLVASGVAIDDIIAVYANAEIEYRMADSIIISIATRGWRLAPGIRDTHRIWITIIKVDSTVVATDIVYALICTEL